MTTTSDSWNIKYSKNLLLIIFVHNKDGKNTKEAIAVSAGANTKKHKCPWIQLHTVLHILRWGTMTALSSDQETENSVSAQSYPRSSCLKGAGRLKDGRSTYGKPGSFLAAPRLLSEAFCSHKSHWNKTWTRTGLPSGEHLSQTHSIDFSTKHNFKWAPCTSDRALQLAGLSETGGSAPLSQQPSKQPVPRLWLQFWQRKIFTFVSTSAFSPSVQKAH